MVNSDLRQETGVQKMKGLFSKSTKAFFPPGLHTLKDMGLDCVQL